MSHNYYNHLHHQLRTHPDNPVIVWPDPDGTETTYTGRDVLDRVAAMRAVLQEANIEPGQAALLAVPVSFGAIGALLAVMSAGAIPVLPPARSSVWAVLRVIRSGTIRAVITGKPVASPLRLLARLLGVRLLSAQVDAWSGGAWPSPEPVDQEQPALISHSSGSTGQPKAIRRSHRVLGAQHQALDTAFQAWPGQRDFPLFPNVLLHNLATGTQSILPDLPQFDLLQLDPARVVAQMVRHQVETMTGNVFYFRNLLAYLHTNPQPFDHVRAVGVGGSPVPEGLVHDLKQAFSQAEVYVIYGSSEAEPIAIRRVDSVPVNPRLGYTVGTIHPTIELRIRPTATLTLPDGTKQPTGEIEVRGPHVAADGWLATGDFGYQTQTGLLILTGRKGNERVHRGVQHYQIEHVVSGVSGVDRVAAKAHETGFVVYVQGRATEGRATEVDIRQRLLESFPERLVTDILFRDELPVDNRHHSKLKYDAL